MKEDPKSTEGCERDLEQLLLALTEQLRLRFERVSAQFGLTPPQATALRRMGCAAPMRDLAEHMGCDASYVTSLADALEGSGLVERQPDPRDRRVKQLVITKMGVQVREKLQTALLVDSPMSTQLSQTDRQMLVSLLAQLLDGYTTPSQDERV